MLTWEPPHRLVLSWHTTDYAPSTEVEVRFTPEGTGTRVHLEHRGWERLDTDLSAARVRYDAQWDKVLQLHAAGGHENGHAIAALILGIASVAVPAVGLLAAPFGLVFGSLGRRRRRGARKGGLATAGLTLAAIGLVLWGVLLLGGVALVVQSGPQGREEQVPAGHDPVGGGLDQPFLGDASPGADGG